MKFSLHTINHFSFYFLKFIYFWLCWVSVAAHRLSLVVASGGYSSLWWASFSLWWLLLLWSTGSRRTGFSSCGSGALERRLSSCGRDRYTWSSIVLLSISPFLTDCWVPPEYCPSIGVKERDRAIHPSPLSLHWHSQPSCFRNLFFLHHFMLNPSSIFASPWQHFPLPLPPQRRKSLEQKMSKGKSKQNLQSPGFKYSPFAVFLPCEFLKINQFIYLWLCWVFVAACGLSLVAASGGYSSSRCAGFSLQWLLLLRSMGSRHAGFSSCGLWAQ